MLITCNPSKIIPLTILMYMWSGYRPFGGNAVIMIFCVAQGFLSWVSFSLTFSINTYRNALILCTFQLVLRKRTPELLMLILMMHLFYIISPNKSHGQWNFHSYILYPISPNLKLSFYPYLLISQIWLFLTLLSSNFLDSLTDWNDFCFLRIFILNFDHLCPFSLKIHQNSLIA